MNTFHRIAIGAAAVLAVQSTANAQTVSSSNGTRRDVTSVTNFATKANQMGGMRITAEFKTAGPTLVGAWGDLGGGRWGVDLFSGNTHWFKLSLGSNDDTFDANWEVRLYQSTGLKKLTFEGWLGNTVFDRSSCFSGGGTPGSSTGNDFDLLDSDWSGVTALYTDWVGVTPNAPVGDLFSKVVVDFNSANFDCGRNCNTDADNQAGDGGKFYFEMDTDNATFASTVPEPSTYALMAAGLLSLGLAARRRRQTA